MKITGERFLPSDDINENALEHWHRYIAILPFVKGKKVLDIASGTGYGSQILSKEAENVLGVDIDKESIDFSKEFYQKDNLSFLQGSVTEIPVLDKSFDIVVSFETIEHVSEKDQKKFLSEVKRILKDDGVFIVSTPNKQIYTDLSIDPPNPFHLKEFYKEEYFSFLNNFFKNIRIFNQRIYTASLLWESEGKDTTEYLEYGLKADKYSSVDIKKEPMYFLAFCSELRLPEIKNSMLIDQGFRLLKSKENLVKKMQNSISWRVTKPLRFIKKIIQRR